jgi:hypothetical protein
MLEPSAPRTETVGYAEYTVHEAAPEPDVNTIVDVFAPTDIPLNYLLVLLRVMRG